MSPAPPATTPQLRLVGSEPGVADRGALAGRGGTGGHVPGRRIWTKAVAVLAASTLIVGALAWLRLRPHPVAVAEPARTAGRHFLDRYLGEDGRVVRLDQGGDTVSEGQAYAMLVAAAIGDRSRFDLAWDWSRTHLSRPDGLLAWRWSDGHVADSMPATDADLDTAWALTVAAHRFGDSRYRRQAQVIGRGILASETADARGRPVLVAGPWARTAPFVVNPSYDAPPALLAVLGRDGEDVAAATGATVSDLTGGGKRLPPEWARVDSDGAASATGAPDSGGTPTYSLQAARLLVWWASDCSSADHRAAAAAAPLLRDGDPATSSRNLDGAPQGAGTHAAAEVGTAAALSAAGDRQGSARLLDQAAALDQANPTYYGSAWVALGRILLTSEALVRC